MINIEPFLIAVAVYLALNVFSFLLFANDKRKAGNGSFRTSEKKLLISAFIGPFGAVLAMKTVRHKTRKSKFLLAYVFLLIHISVFCMIIMNYPLPGFS